MYVDEAASDEQADAILDAFTGKLGGPLADLAELVGERVAVERAPIKHEIVEGAGTLTVGATAEKVHAAMHPYEGPDGSTTTLNNSVFSTVPGSPAYVGVADTQKIDIPEHGYQWADREEKRDPVRLDARLQPGLDSSDSRGLGVCCHHSGGDRGCVAAASRRADQQYAT